MRTWRRPEAVGQKFVANEYVSACSTVTITCDFDEAKIPPYGYGLAIPQGIDFTSDSVYFPCNHEFDVNVDQLKECNFTHTTSGPDDLALGKSYPAYYWLDVKADGSADFHAVKVSTVEAALEANKS